MDLEPGTGTNASATKDITYYKASARFAQAGPTSMGKHASAMGEPSIQMEPALHAQLIPISADLRAFATED